MAAANEAQWITLGRLRIPASVQTAAKNAEVFVFQGFLDGKTSVTVKRVKKTVRIVEKKVLRDINHPNIVRYHTTEVDDEY